MIENIFKSFAKDIEGQTIDQEFWDDAAHLARTEINIKDYAFIINDDGSKVLGIYLKGLYNAWAPYYRRVHNQTPFTYPAILGAMKHEEYFKDASHQHLISDAEQAKRIGKNIRLIIVDPGKITGNLKEFYGSFIKEENYVIQPK